MQTTPHRLIVFTRGHTHHCYLDMDRSEAERRHAEMEAGKSEFEHQIDAPLVINEFEFTDTFEIWCNVNEDVQNLVDMIMAGYIGGTR